MTCRCAIRDVERRYQLDASFSLVNCILRDPIAGGSCQPNFSRSWWRIGWSLRRLEYADYRNTSASNAVAIPGGYPDCAAVSLAELFSHPPARRAADPDANCSSSFASSRAVA